MYLKIHAPARLHLGFLDLNGSCGRQFGGMGLGIEDIALTLTAWRSPVNRISGPDSERAGKIVGRLLETLNLPGGLSVRLEQTIPEHAGLGSGTQMALALGTAIAHLYGLPVESARLAGVAGRGSRSGIGLGVFSRGGFIVDGGRGTKTAPPPVICQLPVPENWRFLIVIDRTRQGLHGEGERAAFGNLGRMSDARAAELCRIALMKAMPAVAEGDCAAFGAAVSRIQEILGAFFSPAQDGRFTSPRVAAAIQGLLEQGAAGGGQTSWGPTGFAIYPSETEGFQAQRWARRQWQNDEALEFVLCRPRNRPAEVGQVDQPADEASGRLQA